MNIFASGWMYNGISPLQRWQPRHLFYAKCRTRDHLDRLWDGPEVRWRQPGLSSQLCVKYGSAKERSLQPMTASCWSAFTRRSRPRTRSADPAARHEICESISLKTAQKFVRNLCTRVPLCARRPGHAISAIKQGRNAPRARARRKCWSKNRQPADQAGKTALRSIRTRAHNL